MNEGSHKMGRLLKRNVNAKSVINVNLGIRRTLWTDVNDLGDTPDVCKFGDLQSVLLSHVMYLFKHKRCDDTRQYSTCSGYSCVRP